MDTIYEIFTTMYCVSFYVEGLIDDYDEQTKEIIYLEKFWKFQLLVLNSSLELELEELSPTERQEIFDNISNTISYPNSYASERGVELVKQIFRDGWKYAFEFENKITPQIFKLSTNNHPENRTKIINNLLEINWSEIKDEIGLNCWLLWKLLELIKSESQLNSKSVSFINDYELLVSKFQDPRIQKFVVWIHPPDFEYIDVATLLDDHIIPPLVQIIYRYLESPDNQQIKDEILSTF